jgi:uncharacterized protein (DUF849 family)
VNRAVIIEVALNGGVPRRISPHVPQSEDELVDDALACVEAGASVVHNHNSEAVIGGPAAHDPAPYRRVWRRIRASFPDIICYPTMAGGGPGIDITERYSHVEALAASGDLDLGLVDPGTTNIGRFDQTGLPRPEHIVYQNTYADAVHMVETCRRHEVGMSVSVFEPGFVRVIRGFADAGRLPVGTFVKFYFGGARAGFGLPPTPTALAAYLEMIDGINVPWLVSVQGGDVVASGLAQHALDRGGHLQVGLEPSADRHRRNVDLVNEASALVSAAGCHPATRAEARALIGLPPRAG